MDSQLGHGVAVTPVPVVTPNGGITMGGINSGGVTHMLDGTRPETGSYVFTSGGDVYEMGASQGMLVGNVLGGAKSTSNMMGHGAPSPFAGTVVYPSGAGGPSSPGVMVNIADYAKTYPGSLVFWNEFTNEVTIRWNGIDIKVQATAENIKYQTVYIEDSVFVDAFGVGNDKLIFYIDPRTGNISIG